jgi:hypothetical protein
LVLSGLPNDPHRGALRALTAGRRAIGGSRQARRLRGAGELGRTFLVLKLIALGILAFRFVLFLAHGFLH